MKKILCIVLSVLLLFGVLGLTAFAEDEAAYPMQAEYPTVLVTGYTSCQLYLDQGTENQTHVWKPDIAQIALDAIKQNPLTFIYDVLLALAGRPAPLTEFMKPYIQDVFDDLEMNPNGTSKYNVSVYPHAVEDTRYDVMSENGTTPDSSFRVLGNVVGKENVYCCTLDWRLGQIDSAAILNAYIEDVLDVTESKKVNLAGISYGGQVVSTYLYYYGDKEQVNNVVMTVPAIGGTKLASRLLAKEDIDISICTLFGFAKESAPGIGILEPIARLFNLKISTNCFTI